MIRLVTFADSQMTRSMKLCASSSLKHGVDKADTFGPDDVSIEFRGVNSEIWYQERGHGYWLWKPYLIYNAMFIADENEIIIYSDAGIEFVNSVKYIIDKMDEDIFFFTNGFPHVEWCKGDVLYDILRWGVKTIHTNCGVVSSVDWETTAYNEQKQVQASVIFFKVNQKTKDFVKEWLLYCQMPGFIDDSPSKLPNYPTFAEHRHDQAILTCLQIKYGYKLHFWPTNYSEHIRHTAQPGDNYPTIFSHHRRRNHEW